MNRDRRDTYLLVINSLAGGGAERVFTTLVSDLGRFRDCCDFTVALLDDEEVEAYGLPDWIKVHRLGSGGSLVRSMTGLHKLVGRLRPDVCLSFLTRANFAAVIACRAHGAKVIISERVNTTAHLSGGAKSAVTRMLARLLYPRANAVVAVSQGVKDTLCREYGVACGKVTVIPNPVDLTRIEQLAREPAQFEIASGDDIGPEDWATMGRLVPTKNTALAVRAFVKAKPEGRLFVLGAGPLRQEIEAMAHSLGVADRVVMCGFVSNPYAVLGRCEGYILSSDAEGFPNAMVEAMALAKPVVATDCPSGPAEILECNLQPDAPARGRGGMLVPCGDEDIMACAIAALQDRELRAQLGEEARQRALEFSVERATQSFWSIIQGQLAAKKGRIAG